MSLDSIANYVVEGSKNFMVIFDEKERPKLMKRIGRLEQDQVIRVLALTVIAALIFALGGEGLAVIGAVCTFCVSLGYESRAITQKAADLGSRALNAAERLGKGVVSAFDEIND